MTPEKRPITAEDLYAITSIEDPRISPDGRWVAYVQVTADQLDNGYKRNIWLAPTDGGLPVQLTRSGKDTQPRWSPDGNVLAFVSSRDDKPQIYLLSTAAPGGEARALTAAPNGANSPAWSPDGKLIAFLAPVNSAERAREDSGETDPKPADKLDSKHRKERRDHDETKRFDPRVVTRIPYRTGTAFLDDRFAQIYIMPTAEGLDEDQRRPRRLTHVDANHEAPQWAPDGQYLYTARIDDPDRDEPWRWSSLFRIRVSDGGCEQLTGSDFTAFTPLPSPDGQWIAFVRFLRERLSERIARLTIIPAAGGTPRDLNESLDRSVSDFRWLPDSSGLVFTALSEGNIELYTVHLTDSRIEKRLAGTMHIENADIHGQGGIAFTASTPVNPSELYWLAADAPQPAQLTRANQKFLESVIVQDTVELRWHSPAGVEIQGWYMLPVGYEPGRQYPLAFNIHGGPHVMWGPGMKSMWHEWQFHAARGYVVFYANPRGAEGYGEAFQMALHGAWGDVAYADLMAGVDALLAQGFVDAARMGVLGGSYGGYMTAWIVGHTDRFAAAAAQRGVYNLLSFSGTTDVASFIPTEFGIELWEDPELLWRHSPLAHAHRIKTPLLIIHSENDYRVPIAEAEQLFTFVRRSGGQVRLVRFPRDGHEMTRSGEPEHRRASLEQIIAWFDSWCQPK